MRREGNFEPCHSLSAAKSAMPPSWATQDPSRVCPAEAAELERLEGGEQVLPVPVAAPVAAQAVQRRAAGRGRGRAAARGRGTARGTARGMAAAAAAAQSPPAPPAGRVPTDTADATDTADDVTAAQGLHQLRQGGMGAGVAGDASPGSPEPLQAEDESRSPPDVVPSPMQPGTARAARADKEDKESWDRAPRNEEVPQPPRYPEDRHKDIQQKVNQMLKVYKQNPKKSYESQWNSYSIWHECAATPRTSYCPTAPQNMMVELADTASNIPGVMFCIHRHYFHGEPVPRCPYSGFVWLNLKTAYKYIQHMGTAGRTNAQAIAKQTTTYP